MVDTAPPSNPDVTPAEWDGLIERIVGFRRELHQHPELPWQEVETARRIRQQLDRFKISWRACAETGTVATLAAKASGRHIALRGDIDALPIVEASGRDWSSKRDGCMHACGHDGHTATLVAAAAWLKRCEESLPGPVSLLFQPAEEGGHGAKRMIEDGALEGVDVIYGWHNWPAIPFGKAVCPDGIVMSGNGTYRIAIQGAGGHASQPEQARDPVIAAAAITMALQTIVSRRLAPQSAAVVSVSSIEAPSGDTIIPDTAKIGGSIRFANPNDRDRINGWIEDIAMTTAAAYGVAAEVDIVKRYNATINHTHPAEELRGALKSELGKEWRDESLAVPIMASEDFSYYLNEIPGAFALIGADDGQGHNEPCHSPRYDFNDRLIPVVARVFARLTGAVEPPAARGSDTTQLTA